MSLALVSVAHAQRQSLAPTIFVTPCKCQGNHGEDRWAAKTDEAFPPDDLSDVQALKPSDMFSWNPLPGLAEDSPRKGPEEERWFRVMGRVVEVKAEADGDIHFALQDADGDRPGMILVEVPLGPHWCALRKTVLGWTKKWFPFRPFRASSKALPLLRQPVVSVFGKAFFDTHHAAKHPLANRSVIDRSGNLAAWEIHPAARIDETVEVRRAILVR